MVFRWLALMTVAGTLVGPALGVGAISVYRAPKVDPMKALPYE